jgi:hypothetical protein
MAKQNVSGREWLDFEHWALEELNLFDFRVKFMTDTEKSEFLGPREVSGPLMVLRDDGTLERLDAPSTSEPEMTDEEWKNMVVDITAEEMRNQAELLALAERLGCSIYLAAYLRHLNHKLEIVADAFAGKLKTQELPQKLKRRK